MQATARAGIHIATGSAQEEEHPGSNRIKPLKIIRVVQVKRTLRGEGGGEGGMHEQPYTATAVSDHHPGGKLIYSATEGHWSCASEEMPCVQPCRPPGGS